MTAFPALRRALEWCEKNDVVLPLRLAADLFVYGAVKSEEYFARVLDRLVRGLYRGTIDELEFAQIMGDLITGQMRRAWYEGMAENGLTPEDMVPEWEEILDTIVDGEKEYIAGFADAIAEARADGTPVEGLLNRADLWANRYADVRNQAVLETAKAKDRFEWVFGDTRHCGTCEALNGLVAWASEWEEAGLHPQDPPNKKLECGGWRCQCELQPTDRRRTPNAYERLMEIATGIQTV